MTFQEQILEGIPSVLPNPKPYETEINHAPKRKEILSNEEKKLALKNALRYFDTKQRPKISRLQRRNEQLSPISRRFWILLKIRRTRL